jgi:tryptophan-rich sensory protein
MHRLISLGVFLLLVVITVAVGSMFTGGEWYQQMNQPSWNPAPMLMASVWAVLYVLMAVSAWMVWDTIRGLASVPLAWWALQLLLGVCWSWVYFGLHRPGWALAVMTFWLLAVLVVIKSFRAVKIEASTLMMPVGAWLLFSWVLGLAQWHLNGGGIRSFF